MQTAAFMIQISEGTTRELDERALKFLNKYGKRIEVLDAKELGLSTIDASVVDYFNHSLFNNVYPTYNMSWLRNVSIRFQPVAICGK